MQPLVTVLMLTAAFFVRPTAARCPRGWWLAEGVRRSGEFSCMRKDLDSPSLRLDSRLYCPTGTIPVIHDRSEVALSCRVAHYQEP